MSRDALILPLSWHVSCLSDKRAWTGWQPGELEMPVRAMPQSRLCACLLGKALWIPAGYWWRRNTTALSKIHPG